MKKLIVAFAILALLPLALVAEVYSIEGQWYNPERTTKIQIYRNSAGRYDGKIAWLREPNENGRPKLDKDNPDQGLRSRPLLDLLILRNLRSQGSNKYDGGTIYDPESGNTYSCKAELTGPNTLKMRGFIGLSLLGRTVTFTRANP